jgi:hypothetical protein
MATKSTSRERPIGTLSFAISIGTINKTKYASVWTPYNRERKSVMSEEVEQQSYKLLRKFAPILSALPLDRTLAQSDLLTSDLLLEAEGNLATYFAPFDYINERALIALVGITPGFAQMEVACRCAGQAIRNGQDVHNASLAAKYQASFAGTMRQNLLTMLDGIGFPRTIGITSSAEIFGKERHLLHATSAIRYPTFVKKNGRYENYTGHSPHILRRSTTKRYIDTLLCEEMQLTNRALIVPLGDCASEAVESLVKRRLVDENRCLLGFPHPSGGNGHRVQRYAAMREHLANKLQNWFN